MNKTILITVFAMIALSFSVSAWHCADTDAAKPNAVNNHYGAWGDNLLLGGTTAGWGDTTLTSLPEGCTGVWSASAKAYTNLNCQDYCDGATLVEYSCGDRPGYLGETVLFLTEHKASSECAQVPEFAPIAAGLALIGAIGAIAIVRRRH